MLQISGPSAPDPRVLWCGGSDSDAADDGYEDGNSNDDGADTSTADEQEDDGGADTNSGDNDSSDDD